VLTTHGFPLSEQEVASVALVYGGANHEVKYVDFLADCNVLNYTIGKPATGASQHTILTLPTLRARMNSMISWRKLKILSNATELDFSNSFRTMICLEKELCHHRSSDPF